MTRTKKLGLVAVVVAGATLLAVVSIRRTEDAGATGKPDKPAPAGKAAVLATGPNGEVATADPVGSLRLEGQVLDADDHPVGGAQVTIDALPAQTATTESDGSFVFEHLLGRRYTLLATAHDGVAGPIHTPVDAHGEPVILRLRASAGFDVGVIDAATGSAISGARIEVRAPIVASGTTSAAGTAALAAIAPGHWPLVVAADGYATLFDYVTASATTRGKRTVALQRGVHARGRVLDAGGNPVADAVVWLENVSDWVAAADPARDSVRTAADGGFEFVGVGRGSYVVRALGPGHATGQTKVTRIDGDTDGIALRVAAGVRVTGTIVRADHAPAAAAGVRAYWNDGNRIAHVDRDGGFMFEGLPGEPIWLVASDGEGTSKPKRIDLGGAAPPGPVELVLENTGTIAGIVVDHTGAPVEGAQVTGIRQGVLDVMVTVGSMALEVSDSSGHFTLHGLATGDYQVSATRDPTHMIENKGIVTATGTTEARVVVASSGGIKGTVALRGGGKPLAYTVRIGRSGLPTSFTTDSFQLEAGPGTRSLWIEGPGFTATAVDGIEVKANAVSDAGAIELARGRTLRGRVTSGDGGSLANAEVLAGGLLWGTGQRVDTGDNGGPEFRSDVKHATLAADGSFELSGAAETSISVVATSASGARSAPVQVPAGSTDVEGIALQIKKAAGLSGTVTVDGKPVRAIVNAQAQDSPMAMNTVMTTDGQYSYDQLAPGRYTVSAILGAPLDGSPFYPRVVDITPGAAATLDIAMAPGPASLTVQTPGVPSGLVLVTTKPGTATSGLALLAELGRQDGGQWALAPIRDGAVTFNDLAAGPARACVVQVDAKGAASPSALAGAMIRGGNLAAMCQTVQLAGKSTVSIGGAK